MHLQRTFLRSSTLALLAVSASAQGAVWTVDDDAGPNVDFVRLDDAIAASADGDVILLQDGSYTAQLELDGKGLTIVGESGTQPYVGRVRIDNVPSTSRVIVRGVKMLGSPGLRLLDNDGHLFFEECRIEARSTDGLVIEVERCDQVVLSHCSVESTRQSTEGAALLSTDSHITLYGCDLLGADPEPAHDGNAGAILRGGSLFASGTHFEGTPGGQGLPTGLPLPDCTNGGAGGAGLRLESGEPFVQLLDCTFLGGAGGVAGDEGCSAGPNAPPIQILSGEVQTLPGTARDVYLPSPLRDGESANVTFYGATGEFAFVLFSQSPATVSLPMLHGILIPNQPEVVFGGIIQVSGSALLPVNIQLPAHLASRTLYVQPLYYDVLATELRLGAPTTSLHLAAGL